jgi:hypothetical protein
VKLGKTSRFSPAISNAAIDRSHDVDPDLPVISDQGCTLLI